MRRANISRYTRFFFLFIILTAIAACSSVPDEDDVRELVEQRFEQTESKLVLDNLEIKRIYKCDEQYWAEISASFTCKFSDYYQFPSTDLIPAGTYGSAHKYDFTSHLNLVKDDGDWAVAKASRNQPPGAK